MAGINASTSDLKKSVLDHCGETTNGNSFYDQNGKVLEYLNKAHVAILSGGNEFDFELSKPWSWAVVKDPSVIILQPPFITGTINVTNGSNQVTFNPAPAISLRNYKLQIADRPDFMRIQNHIANQTNATIDAPYADDTGVNFGFQAILIDYELEGCVNGILRLTQAMTTYQPQDLLGDEEESIYFMDEKVMNTDYPMRRITQGTPNFFCITHKDKNNEYHVRFNKIPQRQIRVEYKFIPIPDALTDSNSSYPIIPVEHRDCLDFAASYFLCLDKNDDRAMMYLQLTQQKLKAMLKSEEKQKTQTSKMRGKLLPRGDLYQRGKRFVTQETS